MKTKLRALLCAIRYIIPNIYFNFHYLPIRHAWKMPVIFYKPHFGMLKGDVKINSNGEVKFGMIKMGFNSVALYSNNGILFQNAGDTITFNGTCHIGNNSAVAVGRKGKLEIGKNFTSTAGLKIACQHRVTIGDDVLCGWEVMMVDSDFHKVTFTDGRRSPDGYKPITVGNGCWIGFRSILMKGTSLNEHCIVSSNSMCNKAYSDSYVLLAGQPAVIKKKGVYRDSHNDIINYPS